RATDPGSRYRSLRSRCIFLLALQINVQREQKSAARGRGRAQGAQVARTGFDLVSAAAAEAGTPDASAAGTAAGASTTASVFFRGQETSAAFRMPRTTAPITSMPASA